MFVKLVKGLMWLEEQCSCDLSILCFLCGTGGWECCLLLMMMMMR